jgi:outer membrane protein assembly factor BamB
MFNPYVGDNSATEISWMASPNILDTDPNFNSSNSVWASAIITFTRPDGTQDIVNGPIRRDDRTVGGAAPRLQLVYTPNMMGNWTVNLYWPGDATYNAVNSTRTFIVGEHFGLRNVFAQLSIRPYPDVGLGQDILVNAWITPPPVTAWQNYQGYMFTFTRPDGTTFTVGPMNSEGEGTVWFNLPLDQLGNWTIKFDFPGDYFSLPASVTRTITVQQDPVPEGYPDTPLPTQAWTFPINTENRNWRDIAGPWMQSYYNASHGAWNPYTEAPTTAHILWEVPAYSGIGGYIGSPYSIQTGSGQAAYGAESRGMYSSSVYSISVIMAGRAYASAGGNIVCFDLRTGQMLWSVPGSFNVGALRGSTPALYSFSSSRFIAYNALDGSVMLNVTGMSMTMFDDPYVYTLTSTSTTPGFLIKWDTTSSSTNFDSRIVWNVTDEEPITPSVESTTAFGSSYIDIQSGLYIVIGFSRNPVTCIIPTVFKAYNLTTGEVEYDIAPLFDVSNADAWYNTEGPATGSGYGLFYQAVIWSDLQGLSYMARNASTGEVAWISEKTDYPWGNFWAYMPDACGDGLIFGLSYSGVYGINATNGKIEWHYIDSDAYNEEPYGANIVASNDYPNNLNLTAGDAYASYSFGSTGPVAGGGLLFAPITEHSPTFLYRGIGLNAVNTTTGEKAWRIIGYYTPTAIAEGVLTASDSYNGFTYAFGKGESATTVSPSSEVIAKGDSVLLKGTVLDLSSAQNGTAAVSDADQEAWMEYLHMQQPFPVNAKGVMVSLDALDPNNNYVHIGDATSDTTGKYSFLWTPEIEGKYTIVASFYSTGAYYGSTAETSVGVTVAPTTTAGQPQQQVTADNTPILYAVIGIGIAILIGIAVAIIVLRKRP